MKTRKNRTSPRDMAQSLLEKTSNDKKIQSLVIESEQIMSECKRIPKAPSFQFMPEPVRYQKKLAKIYSIVASARSLFNDNSIDGINFATRIHGAKIDLEHIQELFKDLNNDKKELLKSITDGMDPLQKIFSLIESCDKFSDTQKILAKSYLKTLLGK